MAGITTAIPSSAVCRVPRKNRAWRALRISISVGITVAIFALVIPKVADYSQVWGTIAGLSVWEVLLLALVMTLHLFTYWPQQTAAMPGLTLGQAAVNAQTTTSIANVLPGGPPVAVAFSYCIYRSWGFTKAEIVLQAMLTGIWNIYVKLALPVIAIVVLAFYGHFSIGLFVAAVIGAGALAGSVVAFAFMLRRKALARRMGAALGRIASALRRVVRKPAVRGWGEATVGLRAQTITLVVKQWLPLTFYTVLSQCALFAVLVLSLRFVGVSAHQVSWAEILGVFAFVRLLATLPLTPGGIGVVELGYISGLALAGGDHAKVVAGVLLFRALSYGVQVPLGGITYIVWRRKKGWLTSPPRFGPLPGHQSAPPVLVPA